MVRTINYNVYEIDELNYNVREYVYRTLMKDYYNDIFQEALIPWKLTLSEFFSFMPNKNVLIDINALSDETIKFEIKNSIEDILPISKDEWKNILSDFNQKMNSIEKNKFSLEEAYKFSAIKSHITSGVEIYMNSYAKGKKPKLLYSELYKIVFKNFNKKVNLYINGVYKIFVKDYIYKNNILFSKTGDIIKLDGV